MFEHGMREINVFDIDFMTVKMLERVGGMMMNKCAKFQGHMPMDFENI
jgi:hypothetical protein